MFTTIAIIISSMCLIASLIGNSIAKTYWEKDQHELRVIFGISIMLFTAIIMYLTS